MDKIGEGLQAMAKAAVKSSSEDARRKLLD
jgi:hypothetical protein